MPTCGPHLRRSQRDLTLKAPVILHVASLRYRRDPGAAGDPAPRLLGR